MHPIGAKSQRHAPLLQRCCDPAQETVIVFVLIRLKIEITRDPAQGFISDPFDKFPHKAIIGLPSYSRSPYRSLFGAWPKERCRMRSAFCTRRPARKVGDVTRVGNVRSSRFMRHF